MEKRNNIKINVSGYFNCRKWKQGEEIKNLQNEVEEKDERVADLEKQNAELKKQYEELQKLIPIELVGKEQENQ